jgi:predicted ABC-type ATPase
LVVAGPNGSGKSTLTRHLIEVGVDFGEYINPDDIAAELDLPEPLRSRQAQFVADHRRDRCLIDGLDFSFETVMSHPSKVDFMSRARDAGYEVVLFFVGTSHPEINISRVESRVSQGGHDVPRDRIVSRYARSLELLSAAALVATRTVVFDNSALIGYAPHRQLPGPKSGLRPTAEVVKEGNHYAIVLEADVPEWVFNSLVRPLQARVGDSEGRIVVHIDQRPGALV